MEKSVVILMAVAIGKRGEREREGKVSGRTMRSNLSRNEM